MKRAMDVACYTVMYSEQYLKTGKTMSVALLRAEVFAALEALDALARDLGLAIRERDADLYAWTDEGASTEQHRRLAARALASLIFPAGDGLTHALPGVLGASAATLQLAQEVNLAKARFKAAVVALREGAAGGGRDEVRHVLAEAGHDDLSLRQAYRELVVLDTTPERIGFTWMTSVRSVRALSRGAAEEYLHATLREEWRLTGALDAIHRLPASAPLYIVREIKPHLRANLWFPGGARRSVMAHSPILFPLDPDQRPPVHGEPARPRVPDDPGEATPLPGDTPAGPRLPRSNRVIASRPLIPGTPIFTSLEAMGERR